MGNNMVHELLSKKWLNFENLLKNNNGNKGETDVLSWPGVYILAYTDRNIEGQAIDAGDIYYVGMSNSLGGLWQRLKQFDQGIRLGNRHSAARRHYEKVGHMSYNDTRKTDSKEFYVAYISKECTVNKNYRKSDDLEKMGQIAMLEYYVLAHIKKITGIEPDLNKK